MFHVNMCQITFAAGCMAGGFMTVCVHVQLLDRPLSGKSAKWAFHCKSSWLLQGSCLPGMHSTLVQMRPCVHRRCWVCDVGTACALVQSAQSLVAPGQLSLGLRFGLTAVMMPTCASWCVCMQVQVDVEGCELQALQGIQDHHWQHIRQVLSQLDGVT